MLQSDWMANEKTKKSVAALAHVVTYVLPFLLLTRSLAALSVIVGTHFVIDRWRLARFVCWAKNWMAPRYMVRTRPDGSVTIADPIRNLPWRECMGTGYPADRPAWLTVWLLIIVDNVMHVLINGAAIRYLV